MVLVIALLAVVLGTWITSDAGFVVVGFRGWQMETTVWAAITALIVLSLAVYVLFKLFKLVLFRNTKISEWFSTKRSLSARRQTLRAIEEETNGNTVEAIRLLVAASQQSSDPILHLLRASELAERIGARDKASELRRDVAKRDDKELQAFRDLNDALELLNQNDQRLGVRKLRRLLEDHPRCAPALFALVRQRQDVEDWTGALEYLDVLSRLSFISDEEIYALRAMSWTGRIQQADPLAVENVWRTVPRNLKHESNVFGAYIGKLREKGSDNKAAHELERLLSRHWDAQLVGIYGLIDADADKQFSTAEGWLKNHADDPVLHLTLGRLHRRAGRTEKARQHLERSLNLGGARDTSLELAELYSAGGEIQKANDMIARSKQDLVTS